MCSAVRKYEIAKMNVKDDTQQLLMRVLREHFKGRYSLVEEALAEIDVYSKNPTKNAYRQVIMRQTYQCNCNVFSLQLCR